MWQVEQIRVRAVALGLMMFLLMACSDDSVPPSPIKAKAWGAPTLIEADNMGYALGPGPKSVAFDAVGNALVVWTHTDGTHYNIWANRYDASTGLWGIAGPVETDIGNFPHPQITIDAAGNALLVWNQSDGPHLSIWANHYNVSTGLWGAAAPIETNTGDAIVPQVTIDPTGNALAVWTQFDGTHNNIWANHYSASTGLWGLAAPIETNTGDASHPQVAIDATGNGLAVWAQFDGTNYSIWANHYSPSTGWGVATLIETNNAESADFPQVAINATGDALAVWWHLNAPFDATIWTNHYSANTGLWGVATPIDNNNPEAADTPQVAIDAAGNGLAVWIQSDSPHITIWANRYSASTGLWGVASSIENLAGDAGAPEIALDPSGNALVVWRQFNNNRGSIWGNRYSANTGLWSIAAPIETNAGDAGGADVAIDATGNALVVWNQSDGPVSSTLSSMWANLLR